MHALTTSHSCSPTPDNKFQSAHHSFSCVRIDKTFRTFTWSLSSLASQNIKSLPAAPKRHAAACQHQAPHAQSAAQTFFPLDRSALNKLKQHVITHAFAGGCLTAAPRRPVRCALTRAAARGSPRARATRPPPPRRPPARAGRRLNWRTACPAQRARAPTLARGRPGRPARTPAPRPAPARASVGVRRCHPPARWGHRQGPLLCGRLCRGMAEGARCHGCLRAGARV